MTLPNYLPVREDWLRLLREDIPDPGLRIVDAQGTDSSA